MSLFLSISPDVLTQDLAMFGNSWVEEEPHQAKCAPVPSMFLSPCASQDAHTMLVPYRSKSLPATH